MSFETLPSPTATGSTANRVASFIHVVGDDTPASAPYTDPDRRSSPFQGTALFLAVKSKKYAATVWVAYEQQGDQLVVWEPHGARKIAIQLPPNGGSTRDWADAVTALIDGGKMRIEGLASATGKPQGDNYMILASRSVATGKLWTRYLEEQPQTALTRFNLGITRSVLHGDGSDAGVYSGTAALAARLAALGPAYQLGVIDAIQRGAGGVLDALALQPQGTVKVKFLNHKREATVEAARRMGVDVGLLSSADQRNPFSTLEENSETRKLYEAGRRDATGSAFEFASALGLVAARAERGSAVAVRMLEERTIDGQRLLLPVDRSGNVVPMETLHQNPAQMARYRKLVAEWQTGRTVTVEPGEGGSLRIVNRKPGNKPGPGGGSPGGAVALREAVVGGRTITIARETAAAPQPSHSQGALVAQLADRPAARATVDAMWQINELMKTTPELHRLLVTLKPGEMLRLPLQLQPGEGVWIVQVTGTAAGAGKGGSLAISVYRPQDMASRDKWVTLHPATTGDRQRPLAIEDSVAALEKLRRPGAADRPSASGRPQRALTPDEAVRALALNALRESSALPGPTTPARPDHGLNEPPSRTRRTSELSDQEWNARYRKYRMDQAAELERNAAATWAQYSKPEPRTADHPSTYPVTSGRGPVSVGPGAARVPTAQLPPGYFHSPVTGTLQRVPSPREVRIHQARFHGPMHAMLMADPAFMPEAAANGPNGRLRSAAINEFLSRHFEPLTARTPASVASLEEYKAAYAALAPEQSRQMQSAALREAGVVLPADPATAAATTPAEPWPAIEHLPEPLQKLLREVALGTRTREEVLRQLPAEQRQQLQRALDELDAFDRQPASPGSVIERDHSQLGFIRSLRAAQRRALEQKLADYSAGRITREQAMAGLTGEVAARMSAALQAIDALRIRAGGNGGQATVQYAPLPLAEAILAHVREFGLNLGLSAGDVADMRASLMRGIYATNNAAHREIMARAVDVLDKQAEQAKLAVPVSDLRAKRLIESKFASQLKDLPETERRRLVDTLLALLRPSSAESARPQSLGDFLLALDALARAQGGSSLRNFVAQRVQEHKAPAAAEPDGVRGLGALTDDERRRLIEVRFAKELQSLASRDRARVIEGVLQSTLPAEDAPHPQRLQEYQAALEMFARSLGGRSLLDAVLKPEQVGVMESVDPRTGETKAWDVAMWKVQNMPQELLRKVARNLQANYPRVYDPKQSVPEIVDQIRRTDTFMFTIENRTEPGKIATVALSLNQGVRGESLPGYAYLGNFSAPEALKGAGGALLKLAQPWLEEQGIHSLSYVTSDMAGNALRYAAQGAQLQLLRSGDKTKLEMYQSLTPKPFEAPGAISRQIPGNMKPAEFFALILPYLEAGNAVRLQPSDRKGGPARLWIYPDARAAGLGPTSAAPTHPNALPGQVTDRAIAELTGKLSGVRSISDLLNVVARQQVDDAGTARPVNFNVDALSSGEIAMLDELLSTGKGKSSLLESYRSGDAARQFLLQSLLLQMTPGAQPAGANALTEVAIDPALVKLGYTYEAGKSINDPVTRRPVYVQIGQQMAVSPYPSAALPAFKPGVADSARLFGDSVLQEFNNFLRRPSATPAEIQVLGAAGDAAVAPVQTDSLSLAGRLSDLIDRSGPGVARFNKALGVTTMTVLGVSAAKTLFDAVTGRALPQINAKDAHRTFNVPKGVWVASVTWHSNVGGVPTTFTAWVALGATRTVALPGQTGGQPRLQIGKDPMTGRNSISLLPTANVSGLELGAGMATGVNNASFVRTEMIRFATAAANPAVGIVQMPNPADGTGLQLGGRTAAGYSNVQRSSFMGARLGPVAYGRRQVINIEMLATYGSAVPAKGPTHQVTLPTWAPFNLAGKPFGRVNLTNLGKPSDAYVITGNPAFDAGQVGQLIDWARGKGQATLDGVLEQLESGGVIRRGP